MMLCWRLADGERHQSAPHAEGRSRGGTRGQRMGQPPKLLHAQPSRGPDGDGRAVSLGTSAQLPLFGKSTMHCDDDEASPTSTSEQE